MGEFEKLMESNKIQVFGAKKQSIGHFSFVPFEIVPGTCTSDTKFNVECHIFNDCNELIYKIRPIFSSPLSKELYNPMLINPRRCRNTKQREEISDIFLKLSISIDPNEENELIKNWNLDDDEEESDIGFVILETDLSPELLEITESNVKGSIIFDGPWIGTYSGSENHINFKFPFDADKNLRLTIVMAMMAMHERLIQDL